MSVSDNLPAAGACARVAIYLENKLLETPCDAQLAVSSFLLCEGCAGQRCHRDSGTLYMKTILLEVVAAVSECVARRFFLSPTISARRCRFCHRQLPAAVEVACREMLLFC